MRKRNRWNLRISLTAASIAALALASSAGAQTLDWAKAQGGTEDEFNQGVAVAGDGTSFTVGWFQGPADFDPGPGVYTLTPNGPQAGYVAALDIDGGFAWAFAIDGPQADTAHGVAADAAGNAYVVGQFRGTADFDPGPDEFLMTAPGTNAFILKLGPGGAFAWARQLAVPKGLAIGVDGGGNVLATGWFWGPTDLDPGPGVHSATPVSSFPQHDVWAVKLDADGDFLWAAQIGGSDATPKAIAADPDGNVLLAGHFSGSIDADPGAGVATLAAGGSEDLFLVKLDGGGAFSWARSLGSTSRATGVAADAAGEIVVGGYLSGTTDFGSGEVRTAVGAQDPFLWRLDPAGTTLWARHVGSDASDFPGAAAVDASGAYLTGWFRGTVDFDPGPDSFPLTSAGSHDPFVWKLDPSGELEWAVHWGGSGQDEGIGLAIDSAGGVYASGVFRGTADLDPGPGAHPATSAGRADQFVVRLEQPDPGCTPVERATLLPGDARAFLQLGYRVAIDGDLAIVGSLDHRDDTGSHLRSAWIFERNEGGGNAWGEVAELVSSDRALGDDFGAAVEISGDLAIVGARHATGAVADSGAAYLFERHAGGTDAWGEIVKLVAADGTDRASFGVSVAVDDDIVAVGATGASAGTTTFAGAVYLFERDAGGPDNWGQVARVVAPDPGFGDGYAWDIDLDGDTLIVSAFGNDDFGERSGAAYVYRRDAGGPGAWGLVQKLLPDDGAAGDDFGLSVGIDGGIAVVGAPYHDGSDTGSGAAYLFARDAGGAGNWGQVHELTAAEVGTDDGFGRYVAIDGDEVVVGAISHPIASREGALFLYRREVDGPGAWGRAAKFVHAGAQPGDDLGYSVAIDGGTVVGGAVGSDLAGFQGGAAFVFDCPDGLGPPDADGDGFNETVDCDDADPAVYPGAPEVCNGVDDNCDGAVDEGLDADGDGTADCFDGCPADPTKLEPGVCGCGVADTDTDGDGTADCLDLCPADPAKIEPGVCGCGVSEADTDGDGTLDCQDLCPADPAKVDPGVCGCGIEDVDTDGDGAFDCVDECPLDPSKASPGICGCGTPDDDGDGDGTADCMDDCPADPAKIAPGACGCGVADTDTDGDGTADCVDLCPGDPGKIDPLVCGCGTPETDTDGDGSPDCVDLCAEDPAKTDPGICGCGVSDDDTDGDGTADCNDLCVDSDLLPTVVVDGCDSGVVNLSLDNGCTLADEALACAEGARNHGQYVACVAHLTRDLKREGAITGSEKGAIDACAAQADLP